MRCTSCGERLMDTDQFCPKCGAKVIREKRCPECGALLREGTRFCHKCGCLVSDAENRTDDKRKVSQETLDIPIDAIEHNILSETAAEIRADRRAEDTPRKKTPQEGAAAHRNTAKSAPAKSASAGNNTSKGTGTRSVSADKNAHTKSATVHSPAKKNAAAGKKAHYREKEWDEDDWDEDEDDWDEDEEGVDVITVMTAVVGCVILVVVAVLGYHMFRQYMPKDYEQAAEESQQAEDGEEQEQAAEQGQSLDGDADAENFTVTIVSNVNVRDNPSTTGTNILQVAKEGEVYAGIGRTEDGEWYQILLEDGTVGYVFHDYVTVE